LYEDMSLEHDRYDPSKYEGVALVDDTPDCHGFMLHDVCWRLLQAALHPQPVPVSRLFHLCKSLPKHLEPLSWGHLYGGLFALDKSPPRNFPGRLNPRKPRRSLSDADASDPYNVPEVSPLPALQRDETESQALRSPRESRDCFARMPLEIREAIAVVTPTKDALNLGLASRSFTDIVTRQRFWASRFAPGAECDFIFETQKSKRATDWTKIDWKRLYYRTKRYRASPELHQRMRTGN
jgi:hypothetical protein